MRILFITIIMFSCTIQSETDAQMSSLKSPVIVISKSIENQNACVKDSLGTVYCFGNGTILGRSLAESRNVGDTIK